MANIDKLKKHKEQLEKQKDRLRALEAKYEIEYGKIARQRLTELSKEISPEMLIVDMTDKYFKKFVSRLKSEHAFAKANAKSFNEFRTHGNNMPTTNKQNQKQQNN